jgi:hypothetical protein
MGKYKQIQDDVFSIFASQEWKEEEIKTIPNNVKSPEGPFIRVNILTDGRSLNRVSVEGMLLIDIFTEAGRGPTSAAEIADALDVFLVNNQLGTSDEGVVQLFSSTFSHMGVEETYSRAQYSIPLKYYRGL